MDEFRNFLMSEEANIVLEQTNRGFLAQSSLINDTLGCPVVCLLPSIICIWKQNTQPYGSKLQKLSSSGIEKVQRTVYPHCHAHPLDCLE